VAEGSIDDIRPCIYHYRCIGNIILSESMACVSSAATGHGDESGPPPAARPRSIVVVGGGPAGLESARLLAASGHRVVLYEAADELGGRLRLAATCDPTMEELLAWLVRQVGQQGVDVRLGVRFAAGLLNGADGGSSADLVVDATGTAWPGVDPLGPWLSGNVAASTPGLDVAILGGDRPGLFLARAVLCHGRRVTVVEPSGVFGQTLGLPGRFREVHDLEQLGARLVVELPPERFDTVIDTARSSPRPIDDLGAPVVLVGDVTGSLGIEAAFSSARRLTIDLASERAR
jgi:threonine dehydrogenase-like Zn-dependent dehydrogenase